MAGCQLFSSWRIMPIRLRDIDGKGCVYILKCEDVSLCRENKEDFLYKTGITFSVVFIYVMHRDSAAYFIVYIYSA